MKRTDYSKFEKVKSKKKPINKADVFIYILALIAFILMVFVLIANRTQDLSAITYLFSENSESEDLNQSEISYQKNNLDEQIVENLSNIENLHNETENTDEIQYETELSYYSFDLSDSNSEQSHSIIDNADETEDYNLQTEIDDPNRKITDTQKDSNETNMDNIIEHNDYKELESTSLETVLTKDEDVFKDENNQLLKENTNTKNQEVNKSDKTVENNNIIVNDESNNEKDDDFKKGDEIIYKVKYGDAMWKIALKFSVSNKELIKYNKLSNPNLIFPGQVIKIPTSLIL